MRTVFLAGVNMFFFICTFAQHDHSDLPKPANNEIFNIIKSLAGDWKGSYKWTGRLSEGPMDAKYYLTGNGTAVIEDLLMNGKAIMTSVYHLDGTDIRLTHYCAAGNQPRLKASEISAGKEDVTMHFQFVDITNLANQDAGHVKGLELKLKAPDQLTLIFTFITKGVESNEQIELTRSK